MYKNRRLPMNESHSKNYFSKENFQHAYIYKIESSRDACFFEIYFGGGANMYLKVSLRFHNSSVLIFKYSFN